MGMEDSGPLRNHVNRRELASEHFSSELGRVLHEWHPVLPLEPTQVPFQLRYFAIEEEKAFDIP